MFNMNFVSSIFTSKYNEMLQNLSYVMIHGKDTLTYPYCNLFPGYRCKYGKLCSLYVKRKVIYYRVTNSIDDGKKWKAQIFGLVVSTFHARVESFHLKPVISFYIYKSYSIFFILSCMYCSLHR